MRDEFFLIFYFFIIFGGKFSGAAKCNYKSDERSYYCKNIVDFFPNEFYGNYHLKCVECRIKTFSPETFPFENSLISFNVSDSGIQYLKPGAFSNLKNVQYLYLQNNGIVNVSKEAFAGLRQMYQLHLQHNFISDITPGFLTDVQVNSVFLNDNKISELPANAFAGSLTLISLDLQNNKIHKLHKDVFGGLDSLEYLDLQNNKLCSLTLGVFRDLRTLRHLNLANNKFSTFKMSSFSGLKNLNTLILANNSLTVFDASMLLPFLHLTKLDISGNGIYYMDANEMYLNAPTLRYLYPEDNTFSCPLLKNVLQFFKSKGIEVENSVGRYDVQNINGITCIEDIITEAISFKYFMQRAMAEAKLQVIYCK